MRISNGARFDELGEHNGYGYATARMIDSLTRLGYEVNPNDDTADVEIWFDQPHNWKWSNPDAYHIGYHPWESTRLMTKRDRGSGKVDWADVMNQCDEIWTPSPLIAKWYREYAGITVPVYVYEHGVDAAWSPVRREASVPFKFLHVGAEASRKGAQETMVAFRTAFGSDRGKTVELNMKMISQGWSIIKLPGINYINQVYDLDELIDLFHANHVFVYPSWGEGFGLNPLQALATGMPTIVPTAWAPYAKYIHPKLAVSANLWKSPWPNFHPGLMLKPNPEDILAAMKYAVGHYDELVDWHMAQVPELTAEYSWDRLTREAFEALENRLEK